MFIRSTAIRALVITLTLGWLQLASAEVSTFQTTVKSSSEHLSANTACDNAFDQAESEALQQLKEHFLSTSGKSTFSAKLIAENESRTLQSSGKTVCVFQGTWEGSTNNSADDLIGSEQFIDGQYSGNCLDRGNGDICWQRIVQQAKADLRAHLSDKYGDLSYIQFVYTDFEGRQRDQYRQKRLEMTADGRFFFDIVDRMEAPQTTTINIQRQNSPARQVEPLEKRIETQKQAEPKKDKSDIDVTLFYAWDKNDNAQTNDLGISSGRWGVGLWAHNRIGFVAFKGSDQLGIADDGNNVKNVSGRYDTMGVGMGFRLWDNHGITLENMIYYVDAEPYQATVAPGCDGCSDRIYRSDDYLQATVNLKTNSTGLNVGWMFTWKLLENERNFDSLSSGLYLELQL